MHLHRFGTKENVACECGERGTPEHILYQCRLADPGTVNLRGRLGDEDTARILREPEMAEVLAGKVGAENVQRRKREI